MKRIAVVAILIAGLLDFSAVPAQAGIADCISVGSPSVYSSSTSIQVTVSMVVNCSKAQLSTGGGATYSIEGESSLSSSCSGPYSLMTGTSGTITCTIRIGSSLGSIRTGATSSTLRIWFAYDFSTKFVSFSHKSIPSTLSGGGTTVGGTPSGGTVTPSCTSAPKIPNLSYSILSDGIQFTSTAQSTGEKATNLYYSYSYFDGIKGAWQGWVDWISVSPTTTISFKAPSGNNNTYVAFGVYASNSCGQSDQARESANHFGLQLPELPASSDAAKEATDAANAETDAANTAADNPSSEVINAQNAADQVAALSAQVEQIISSLKVQLAALNALVLKIQAKISR